MTRPLGDLKPAEIREAVAALMPEHGRVEAHTLLGFVAERLGSSRAGAGHLTTQDYADRVRRALNTLAENGTLTKIGINGLLPNGSYSNVACWYTPEAYERERQRGEEEQAARAAGRERWGQIAVRLLGADITLSRDTTIAPGDWEKLLTLAGL